MGYEVAFEAVRKSDFVPYASMYLGGNGTAKAIGQTSKSVLGIDEFEIVPLGDWKDAIDFIVEIEESFYLGNHGDEVISFINRYQDRMAYFLRIG